MKLKLTLLLITLSITYSYAQYSWTSGQLVLKNGTTLTGLIKLPVVSKNFIVIGSKEQVQFKTDKKAKKQKYDETQVKQIIFKNTDTDIAYFEYVPTSENRMGIFKIITQGKATLYGKNVSVSNSAPMYMGGANGGAPIYWSYDYSNFDEFYVIKENETVASPLITVRISRSFKQRSIEYFADCPSVVAKLEDKTYRKEDIKEMVEAYNSCN